MAEQLICNQQVDGSTPFTSSSLNNLGEFPSGQRGQTVNLLSLTSLVRIQLPPPKNNGYLSRYFFIQVADLAYHQLVGLDIITALPCILRFLRLDEMQGSRLGDIQDFRLDDIQHFVLMLF